MYIYTYNDIFQKEHKRWYLNLKSVTKCFTVMAPFSRIFNKAMFYFQYAVYFLLKYGQSVKVCHEIKWIWEDKKKHKGI